MSTKRLFVLFFALLITTAAHAHKASDAYLYLNVEGTRIDGQWDIALRDLDHALGLDADDNGHITWGELRARHGDIAAYTLARLQLAADDVPCTTEASEQLVDQHNDGAYAVLRFTAACPAPVQRLEIAYRFFFELDPQHRGLLRLEAHKHTVSAIFSPATPVRDFQLAATNGWSQFSDYFAMGVWHIWHGLDHVLFLITLLLPAVLHRHAQMWIPVPHARGTVTDIIKIVTAFTVAHSLTLCLATLGIVNPPSRWVESVIAASVILAALNNVYPLLSARRWLMALIFGLVHGFGFAAVLTDSGLESGNLVLPLIAFNLGVETGQLMIVALFLPLALLARHTVFYHRVVMVFGSLAVAGIALIWFFERTLEIHFASLVL